MKSGIGGHRPVCLAALVVVATSVAGILPACAMSSSGEVVNVSKKISLYSVATSEQFVNNEDDRARGEGTNPFGNFRDESPVVKETANGPFPGDESVFTFSLYTNARLETKAGSAVLTCLYNFNKNAFCDATYQLDGGTLVAAGAFNFNASNFVLVITGGYGKYSDVKGVLEGTPGVNHSQRLAFAIHPA